MESLNKTFGRWACRATLVGALLATAVGCATTPKPYEDPTTPTPEDIQNALINSVTGEKLTCEDLTDRYSFLAGVASHAYNSAYNYQSYVRGTPAAIEKAQTTEKNVKALVAAAEAEGCPIENVHFRFQ